MSICIVGSFPCVILQFGVLCCLIWINYTMALSRDDILAYRHSLPVDWIQMYVTLFHSYVYVATDAGPELVTADTHWLP